MARGGARPGAGRKAGKSTNTSPPSARARPRARWRRKSKAVAGRQGRAVVDRPTDPVCQKCTDQIARQYMKQEHPGEYRFKTIGRYFAYHGTTLATLDAGGMGERKAKFEPFSGNFVHVAPPYCYRCPFGLTYPSCGLACVKNIEATILGEGPETVAEVIVEPVMRSLPRTAGGCAQPNQTSPRRRARGAPNARG